MTYVTYSCTFCHRSKTFLKDDIRTVPDHCIITKGCLGRLNIDGEDSQQILTNPVSGLTDWYPRGKSQYTSSSAKIDPVENVSLASSINGGIAVAIRSVAEPTASTIILNVQQRKSGDIEFSQYLYKTTTASTSSISGRDLNGKNLRFDSQAISESRVTVLVNGVVSTTVQLSANTVTFVSPLSMGSNIEILVFSSVSSTENSIILTKASLQIPSLARGSWSNIAKVERQTGSIATSWWLYLAESLNLVSGAVKVNNLSVSNDAVVLLASYPYEAADRRLNFVLELDELKSDYVLNVSSSGKMTVHRDKIKELYPPLSISYSSFISDDLNSSSASSGVVTDSSEYLLQTEKIIGPT